METLNLINVANQEFRKEFRDSLMQAKKQKEDLYIKTIMMEQQEIVSNYELGYM